MLPQYTSSMTVVESRVQQGGCGRDEQTGLARRLRDARGLHTSWCEGVVNGALAPTRAWCETLGTRYAELATRPVPVPRAQSPESTPAPGGSPVGMGPRTATGTGTGLGLEQELSVLWSKCTPYCALGAQDCRALRKGSVLSRQDCSNPAPPLARVRQPCEVVAMEAVGGCLGRRRPLSPKARKREGAARLGDGDSQPG